MLKSVGTACRRLVAVLAAALAAGALGAGGSGLRAGTAAARGTSHGPDRVAASYHRLPSVVSARMTSARPQVTSTQPQQASVSLSVSPPTVAAGGVESVEVTEQPAAGESAVSMGVEQTPSSCLINGGGPLQLAVPAPNATGSYSAAWSVQANCTTTVEGYVVLSDGATVTSAPQEITVVPRPTPTPPPNVPAGTMIGAFDGPLPARTSRFGASVAVSGSVAVVGDPFQDQNTGAAFVYTQTATGWVQSAVLHGTTAGEGSNFGQSVAITGSTIVVGATFEYASQHGALQNGGVYIFSRSGAGWVQTQELATPSLSPPDRFGTVVAASQGTVAVLNGPLGAHRSNVDYLYIYSRGPDGWSLRQRLSATDGGLPCSLAMSAATIAVGSCTNNTTTQLNVVALFAKATGQWRPAGQLSGPSSVSGTGYGNAVAVSDTEIAVGAPNAGEVYTYRHTSSGWGAQSILVGEAPFGAALALDGSRLDVTGGAGPTSSQEAPVDVYTLAPSGWRGIGVLQAPSAPEGFGDAIAETGTLTLVGAPGLQTTAPLDAAYLFEAPHFTTFARIAGSTADATAGQELAHQFPAGSCPGTTGTRAVILATDANYPDALSSAYLARSLGTGILLTPTATLSQATKTAIADEGITQVEVVGGPLAVSTAVVDQIEALPAYECGGGATLPTGPQERRSR